jgi:hypothetical protein
MNDLFHVAGLLLPAASYRHHFVTSYAPAVAEFALDTNDGLMHVVVTWPTVEAMERDLKSFAGQIAKYNEEVIR